MHYLADTVAQPSGSGKITALKILKKGQHHLDNLSNSSSITTDLCNKQHDLSSCYGVRDTLMSDLRFWVCSMVIKDKKKERNLCTQTTFHSANQSRFLRMRERAFFQTSSWLLADSSDQPALDPLKYGWTRDELTKTILPVQLPPRRPATPD